MGVARPPPATPSHPRAPRQLRPLALRLPRGHQVGAISQQRELLTLTESIHIEKLPGSRTRDLVPRGAYHAARGTWRVEGKSVPCQRRRGGPTFLLWVGHTSNSTAHFLCRKCFIRSNSSNAAVKNALSDLFSSVLNGPSALRSSAPNFSSEDMQATWDLQRILNGSGRDWPMTGEGPVRGVANESVGPPQACPRRGFARGRAGSSVNPLASLVARAVWVRQPGKSTDAKHHSVKREKLKITYFLS